MRGEAVVLKGLGASSWAWTLAELCKQHAAVIA